MVNHVKRETNSVAHNLEKNALFYFILFIIITKKIIQIIKPHACTYIRTLTLFFWKLLS
jgi:hypothetical protein